GWGWAGRGGGRGGRNPRLPAWGAPSARRSKMLRRSGRRLGGDGLREQIKGAGGGAHLAGGDAQVAARRGQAAMTEQEVDSAHISSALQEMDRESVPHGVRGDRFGDAGGSMRFPARQLDSIAGDVAARDITREEPWLGLFETPPVAEDFQQPGGEHDVAIFLPLA